jgi:hypothetical protein
LRGWREEYCGLGTMNPNLIAARYRGASKRGSEHRVPGRLVAPAVLTDRAEVEKARRLSASLLNDGVNN